MDVYILDSLLRRSEVVDKYESLIWTERFNEMGDFELDLRSNREHRRLFVPGVHLAINNSYRVMTVESVEDKIDEEGKESLKVIGRSLEATLESRVARNAMVDLVAEPSWQIIGPPGDVARMMFDHICRNGALSLDDKIPFLMPGTIFPADTFPETETSIWWEQEPDSLYNAIHNVCSLYDLGFRLVRNFDQSELYFDVYSGNDLTTRQTNTAPIIFSVGLDNLQDTTEFSTIEQSKNVAYVFSDFGYEIVFGDLVDPEVDGFDRQVMVVTVSDIPDPVEDPTFDISAALIQRGHEELQKHRTKTLFDGEINRNSEYTYGVDYQLGDVVEMRNKDGVITYKRVTEQIFVVDSSGERSYPTLSMELYAGANTWMSWNNKTTVWSDFTAEVWADM